MVQGTRLRMVLACCVTHVLVLLDGYNAFLKSSRSCYLKHLSFKGNYGVPNCVLIKRIMETIV